MFFFLSLAIILANCCEGGRVYHSHPPPRLTDRYEPNTPVRIHGRNGEWQDVIFWSTGPHRGKRGKFKLNKLQKIIGNYVF
jgi:hypothetical protein